MLELAEPPVDAATRLLIVDDDPDIRSLTAEFLTGHGYAVDVAENGTAMRAAMARQDYALVVLDVMMPDEDGLSILRSMNRATAPPIIILSVIGEEVDRIVGLEMGADDYIAKPANPRELLARVRSVLRRQQGAAGTVDVTTSDRSYWQFAGWRLDPLARLLTDPDEVAINLSDGEFRLLMALAEHPRRVLTRDFLLDASRGANAEHFDRAIDVQISRLRRKLQRSDGRGGDDLIRTVRNEGYLFTADVERRVGQRG
jgi:two-component system OmpR family response regulator